jgi:hypothetical protein
MKQRFLVTLLALSLLSCDIRENESVNPSESFLRVFDTQDFGASFEPLDIVQTSDDGFLLLSGTRRNDTNFPGAHIIKSDKDGMFESQQQLSNDFLHPVDQWIELNGQFYFVCMNGLTRAQLVSVTETGDVGEAVALNTTYPLHVSKSNGNILLLSYDNENKNTVLSVINTEGQTLNSQAFNIGAGDDVEEPIIDHFNRTGRQLPFFAGTLADGSYYFNGFYNFTVSLVFTDLSSTEPSGVVQGQQDDGSFSALRQLSGGDFAASRFNFGDNFYLPQVTINPSGLISGTDLGGIPNLELIADAPVTMERVMSGSRAIVLFASNTKGGQIMLSAYDEDSGELLAVDYIGFSNPYEVSDIIQTKDEGIALVGKTFISGRFSRVCLIKLSSEELAELSQQ